MRTQSLKKNWKIAKSGCNKGTTTLTFSNTDIWQLRELFCHLSAFAEAIPDAPHVDLHAHWTIISSVTKGACSKNTNHTHIASKLSHVSRLAACGSKIQISNSELVGKWLKVFKFHDRGHFRLTFGPCSLSVFRRIDVFRFWKIGCWLLAGGTFWILIFLFSKKYLWIF